MTLLERQTAYAEKALAGALADIAGGAGGFNNALFKAAARMYQLADAGLFDADALTDRLADAGIAAGNPRNAVRDTLRSAQKAAGRSEAVLPDFGAPVPASLEPRPPHLEPCEPPCTAWQACGGAFVSYAEQNLWSDPGDTAWDWLWERGFRESTIARARLGYNPRALLTSRAKWGLPPDDQGGDTLGLPAGVVIPYYVGGALWKIEVRRLVLREGEKKYKTIAGSSNALYNADALRPNHPAAICEGAFDALAISQAAREIAAPVACGTTTGARRIRWIAQLGACLPVLVTMDADDAGEGNGRYWLDVLGARAKRWAPIVDDPAAMLRMGLDVRGWIQEGLA